MLPTKLSPKQLSTDFNQLWQKLSPYQNAFIKGRSITDNIILGSEIINVIDKKRKGKGSIGALKLDMDKAYDGLS